MSQITKLPVQSNVIKYGKWRISRLRSVTTSHGNEIPQKWDGINPLSKLFCSRLCKSPACTWSCALAHDLTVTVLDTLSRRKYSTLLRRKKHIKSSLTFSTSPLCSHIMKIPFIFHSDHKMSSLFHD